jgi:hypothetical protein
LRVRHQGREEQHTGVRREKQHLAEHQLGQYASGAAVGDQMTFVQHAERERREGLGCLAESERALLRRHDQDLSGAHLVDCLFGCAHQLGAADEAAHLGLWNGA